MTRRDEPATGATAGSHDRASGGADAPLAIDARDVRVTYDDGTEAVAGIDLSVPAGECFGFLGPNGAGKTTAVKTLVTLLRPTGGSVRINGYETATDPRRVRESIGYMAQETSVDPELTARENLRLACELYGVPPEEREPRIAALLDLVGLAGVADQRAETFSGGMAKRLDAASALIHRPPVVFLDEPTTGLDPEVRRDLWTYVEAINDRGVTVFLTTQYLAEADRLCDRLAVLQDGEVIARDTPERLKSAVGGEILDLRLADPADRDRAARAVRDVDALADAAVEPTDDGLTITAARARSAVMDLFVALDDAGIAVTGFDARSPTLDDVFLSLTDADGPGGHDRSPDATARTSEAVR